MNVFQRLYNEDLVEAVNLPEKTVDHFAGSVTDVRVVFKRRCNREGG